MPLKSDEIRSLAGLVAQMKNDSAEAQAELERTLASSQKLTRSLEKDFKKIQASSIKDIGKKQKQIKKLIDEYDNLSDSQKELLKQLQNEVKDLGKANDAIIKYTQNSQQSAKSKDKMGESLSKLTRKLTDFISPLGIASLAIEGMIALYQNWVQLNQRAVEAMGRLSQTTGATTRQFAQLRTMVEGMRGVFSELEGEVDGYAMSSQFVQELVSSFRNLNQLTPDLQRNILAVGRGLGVGTEGATQLFRLLQTGVGENTRSLEDFAATMSDLGQDIGALPANLTRDFIEARSSVAQFGREGVETFRRSAMMANEFGFETQRIFDMMRGFDTFQQASTNVNQLNAMLGTSLNSFELMTEQDPARRLEMVRSQLVATGQTWNNMSRQARQAISQMTGQSEDILARVFGEGRSFNDIQREQANAEQERQRQQQTQIDNQTRLNDLLRRSSVIFETWDRIFQRIMNELSTSLTPVFEVIHEEATGLLRDFGAWLTSVVRSGQAQRVIQDIGNILREGARWLRDNWAPMWERIKTTWQNWGPVVRVVGGILMEVLKFASEHPGVIIALFAASRLMPFISGLRTIAQMMGPGGAIQSAAGGMGGALAGALAPVAAVAGSYALAGHRENQRVEQGGRVRQRDTAALLAESRAAQSELTSRGNRWRAMGSSQQSITGRGNFLTALQEGVGAISGVEASAQGADVVALIDQMINTGNLSPARLQSYLQRTIPPEMLSQILRRSGQRDLPSFIASRYQIVQARAGGQLVAANEIPGNAQQQAVSGAATSSAVQTAPTSAGTSIPSGGGTGGQTQVIQNTIMLNGRELGTALTEISMRTT